MGRGAQLIHLRKSAIALQFAFGLVLAGCTGNQYPAEAPDSRDPNLTWAQRHYIKKMQYQQWTNDRLP